MKFNRRELYDLVWSEPMTTLAKRFNISDNGIRKHCKSMNIPYPPAGYWAKVYHGKSAEKVPLPNKYKGKKREVHFREPDPGQKVDISIEPDPYRERQKEIMEACGDILMVPEILYAKEPIIIDTKEDLRIRTDQNRHLIKNPYKSKKGPTLSIHATSPEFADRALRIFSTVIKALQFRNHDIAIKDLMTFAVVNDEEMKVDLVQRIHSGKDVLSFRIYDRSWGQKEIKDSAKIPLEEKIVQIIAYLEIHSEHLKAERIRLELERKKEEERKRKQEEFEKRKDKELQRVKSLFTMADRFYHANVLRDYITRFENFLEETDNVSEEALTEIKWAKHKIEWLDPFINAEDDYLDEDDMDELLYEESKPQNSRNYTSWSSSTDISENSWRMKWLYETLK
ncbi:MAG: hypothetical protein LUE26_09370 [Alistipes sp.]|nr:hypothetical protein [Alistipes sp.]